MTAVVEDHEDGAPPLTGDATAPTDRRRPASALAVTSVVLGVLATLMALGVVWFFLALPFGLVAAGCAIADRARTRRDDGVAAGGPTTIGLVLGLASIPLALGALWVIPRVETLASDAVADVQSDVQTDLTSLEETTTANVERLDRTLREVVRENDDSWHDDFAMFDKQTKGSLDQTEKELREIIDGLERSTGADLSRLEGAARADVARIEARIAALEGEARAKWEQLGADVQALRTEVESGS